MSIEPTSTLATTFAKALEPEAAKTTARFTEKLFGPALDEYGLIFAESIRLRRFQKQIHTLKRANEMLEAAHIDPQSVPLKTLVPLLEGASLEEDESLQEKWAALLANAASGRMNAAQLPSFSQILKEMSGLEAAMLDAIFSDHDARTNGLVPLLPRWGELKNKEKNNLVLNEKDFQLLKENLFRLGLLKGDAESVQRAINLAGGATMISHSANLSLFGRAFLHACQPPKAST